MIKMARCFRSFAVSCRFAALFLCCLTAWETAPASAQGTQLRPGTNPASFVGIEEKLNAQVPLDLTFRDETAKTVALKTYFRDKPVLLNLIFYKCGGTCSLQLDAMAATLRRMRWSAGKEFTVVTVSINPEETPQLALAKKKAYLALYSRPGADRGWHFLTGDQAAIQRLAESVGFRYAFDLESERFEHTTAVVVLTPQGRISRYVQGLEYAPSALRLAVAEASLGTLGTVSDRALLYLAPFNRSTGRYELAFERVLWPAVLVLALSLGAFTFVLLRHERQKAAEDASDELPHTPLSNR